MRRPVPVWLLLLCAAILGGLVALVFDRGFAALRPSSPTTSATSASTQAPPAVVEVPTIYSTAVPTSVTGDVASQLAALQSALVQQNGMLLVSRAERHTALAAEALQSNDFATADRELVAARTALDGAFGLLSEDLKQIIDGQRREVGRMRSELQVDPEGLDQRLHATQELLLGLIVAPAQ